MAHDVGWTRSQGNRRRIRYEKKPFGLDVFEEPASKILRSMFFQGENPHYIIYINLPSRKFRNFEVVWLSSTGC